MVKTTSLSSFQAAQRSPNLDIFVTPEDTAEDVAEQIQRKADDAGIDLPAEMVAEQAANAIESRPPFNLSTFARKMVDEREADEAATDTVALWAGLDIEVERDEAYGLIQGKLRQWLDDRGIIVQEDEIRAKTNELYSEANYATPRPSVTGATISNSQGESADLDSPEGQLIIEGVVMASMGRSSELPGMPPKPAPKMILRVPSEAEFGDDGEEFFISSTLRDRAKVLTDRHPDLFDHLDGLSVTYLWKKAGGKSKGAAVFGKCSKPSGLLKLFSESTFVIWLAADHCRSAYFGDPEIEQTLFHEMLHSSVSEPDEETGRGGGPQLVPHQLEIFHAEIEVYGLEAAILREAAPLFRQAVYGSAAPAPHSDDYDARPMDAAIMQAGTDLVRELDEILDGEPALDLSGAGVLIWPDGTPMTPEEIAEMEAREAQEAAELRDDPAEFDDEDDDDRPRQAFPGSTEG